MVTRAKIREVGPRDGFQNEPEVIATDDRDRIDEVNVFLSASESHNRHNVNRSIAESPAGVETVLAEAGARKRE
jgi:isopropylmalate/homocitrate/citramalate synthase